MTGQPDSAAQPAPSADANFSQDYTELRRAVVAVNQLGENVREGKVSLDPAVGASLLAALVEHGDDVTNWQHQVGELARNLPMGDNPVGTAMGAKFSGRAQGHDMSLSSVLSSYSTAITDAATAIEQAMRRYQSQEEEISQSFGRIRAE